MTVAQATDTTPITPEVRILHLEDSHLDHQLAVRALATSPERYTVDRVETLEGLQNALQLHEYAVVLADYRLNGFSALDAWRLCSQLGHNVPFVLLSGTIGETAAVEAVQAGISDYLHKDDIRALPRVIRRALDLNTVKAAKHKADIELQESQARISALAGHLQTAIEAERAAIAREIHDDIGGALTSVRLDLGWMQRHSATPELRQHVDSAIAMLHKPASVSCAISVPPFWIRGYSLRFNGWSKGLKTVCPARSRSARPRPTSLSRQTPCWSCTAPCKKPSPIFANTHPTAMYW
jgi:CheY-like chemotaxis protein